MSLPRIRKDFLKIKAESAKAILFLDFDGKEYWIPKSLVTLIKDKKEMVVVTLAAFKFEEITNIKVEAMADTFIATGGEPLQQHITQPIPLMESEVYPLLPKQRPEVLRGLAVQHYALFWETGTGKTLASLTIANSRYIAKEINNVVILCPASLQEQWKKLGNMYFPL
jgi:hypothetical protein